MIDRYAIGERQTSACAVPTNWLLALDLDQALRQSFGEFVVHTPGATVRWPLPSTFSTFDYEQLCELMWRQTDLPDSAFETATVTGRSGHTVHTDRGDLRAPLIVDALGWRRVLSNTTTVSPPHAPMSRGLEVHPAGTGDAMELWIDPGYIRSGYGWSFPAADEVRVGIGSFWPSHHVKEPTVRLAADLDLPPTGYQGNWIPHQLRPAVEEGVFFVGDSAGHCLPLTAEGIRTAFYFGLACGERLQGVLAGHMSRDAALRDYAAFSAAHKRKYSLLLGLQRVIGQLTATPAITVLARALENPRVAAWVFGRYMAAAGPPPRHTLAGPPAATPMPSAATA